MFKTTKNFLLDTVFYKTLGLISYYAFENKIDVIMEDALNTMMIVKTF